MELNATDVIEYLRAQVSEDYGRMQLALAAARVEIASLRQELTEAQIEAENLGGRLRELLAEEVQSDGSSAADPVRG